jgi:hypothetical protein
MLPPEEPEARSQKPKPPAGTPGVSREQMEGAYSLGDEQVPKSNSLTLILSGDTNVT